MIVLFCIFQFYILSFSSCCNDCFADEDSRERTTFSPAIEEETPIEPISDISIDQINNLMFGDR